MFGLEMVVTFLALVVFDPHEVEIGLRNQALSVMPSEINLASTTIPVFGVSEKARLKPVS